MQNEVSDRWQGSEILKTLLNQDQFASVAAFTRKPLTSEITSDKLKPQVQEESTSWPAHLLELSPKPATLFSGLATTRAVAGGFDKQWEIDYQLNYDLAKAAKDAGVRFYVLISSNGADSSSFMGYPKMKGKLEDDVKELGFERTIILRPGLIGGTRREEDSRPSEFAIRRLADYLGKISNNKLKDFWTQDADVTARAAVAATLECIDEAKSSTEALKPETKTIKMSDIIKLGKTDCEKQSP